MRRARQQQRVRKSGPINHVRMIARPYFDAGAPGEYTMGNKMLIDATHPEETRVVVMRGNRVEEFDYEFGLEGSS